VYSICLEYLLQDKGDGMGNLASSRKGGIKL
jgi:hypothetical protein